MKRVSTGEEDELNKKCCTRQDTISPVVPRLSYTFFDVPCIELAKNLLGTMLARKLPDGTILRGKIVETESYLGGDDMASQSRKGKITPRNEPMFMKPGTMYVYLTYGMYHCFNISSQGDGAAVLLRAVEPLEGLDRMHDFRIAKRKSNTEKKSIKPHELCNGPAKLCISFNINIENCNKQDITTVPDLWIEPRSQEIPVSKIKESKRIGIESAGREWADKLLRFHIVGNSSVSRPERKNKNVS